MMQFFEEPEVTVVNFTVEDVITTSQSGLVGWAPDSDDSEFG